MCDPPKKKLFKQNDIITPYNLKLKLFGVLAASNKYRFSKEPRKRNNHMPLGHQTTSAYGLKI